MGGGGFCSVGRVLFVFVSVLAQIQFLTMHTNHIQPNYNSFYKTFIRFDWCARPRPHVINEPSCDALTRTRTRAHVCVLARFAYVFRKP